MYLCCLTQENYTGLSKKTKDRLPWARSKTTRSAARPPLLGWRCSCVLVRILVFPFHLLSWSRRWLRWIDSGVLSEGCSVQARSVADPVLQSSLFSFSSEDLEKFEVFPQSGERRIKLSLKKSLTQIKLFLRWLGTVVTSHTASNRQAYTPVISFFCVWKVLFKSTKVRHCGE